MVTSINVGQLADNSAAAENGLSFAQIQENFAKFIVTPLNAFGLGGFLFDVEGETTSDLTSDITDHYLEDNVAVQDHIALKPQILTLRGYVGEVVYEGGAPSSTILQKAVQKLTVLNSFLPTLSKAAQQIQSSLSLSSLDFTPSGLASRASTLLTSPTLNNVVDLWALTKNINPAASKQQKAFMYFKALQEGKLLISLQTPFEFITNMAIIKVVALQDERSKYISDFSITLKKIRTVSVRSVQFDPKKYQNRTQQQAEPTAQQGNNQGQQEPLTSTLFKWAN